MPGGSRGGALSIWLMSIDAYGRVRAIEGGGFEEKKCYMQHRNHATLPLHATLIFSPVIDQHPIHLDLSFRYPVTNGISEIFRHSGIDFDHWESCLIVIPRISYRSPIPFRWAMDGWRF